MIVSLVHTKIGPAGNSIVLVVEKEISKKYNNKKKGRHRLNDDCLGGVGKMSDDEFRVYFTRCVCSFDSHTFSSVPWTLLITRKKERNKD